MDGGMDGGMKAESFLQRSEQRPSKPGPRVKQRSSTSFSNITLHVMAADYEIQSERIDSS